MRISVVKAILDGNYAQLKEYCDEIVGTKIVERVNAKKIEVLAKINGKSLEEMSALVSESEKEDVKTDIE
jgi:transketolase